MYATTKTKVGCKAYKCVDLKIFVFRLISLARPTRSSSTQHKRKVLLECLWNTFPWQLGRDWISCHVTWLGCDLGVTSLTNIMIHKTQTSLTNIFTDFEETFISTHSSITCLRIMNVSFNPLAHPIRFCFSQTFTNTPSSMSVEHFSLPIPLRLRHGSHVF